MSVNVFTVRVENHGTAPRQPIDTIRILRGATFRLAETENGPVFLKGRTEDRSNIQIDAELLASEYVNTWTVTKPCAGVVFSHRMVNLLNCRVGLVDNTCLTLIKPDHFENQGNHGENQPADREALIWFPQHSMLPVARSNTVAMNGMVSIKNGSPLLVEVVIPTGVICMYIRLQSDGTIRAEIDDPRLFASSEIRPRPLTC